MTVKNSIAKYSNIVIIEPMAQTQADLMATLFIYIIIIYGKKIVNIKIVFF